MGSARLMSRPMMTHRAAPQRCGGDAEYSPARLANWLCHGLLAVVILASSVLPVLAQSQTPAQPPAQPKPEVERIQDWTLQCTKAQADKPRTCFLIHDVYRADGNQRILQIVVGRFGTDNVLAVLFFVPLGIRLPPGLTFQIDQNNPRKVPLERCSTKGCQAQVLLDDSLLDAFKAGNGGELSFDDAAGRSIVVKFSLKGFTSGIGKLP